MSYWLMYTRILLYIIFFFFSSRRRHTRFKCDWSSDVCSSDLDWRVAVLLGFLVALSSTAIVLKGLTDKGEIDAPHGRLATGVLIFQDLCVVPMMLVLPFLAGRPGGGAGALLLALGKAVLVVISVLVLARTVVPRALSVILRTR